MTNEQVDILVDALCSVAKAALPWFRFRPFLADPKDDLFVECALAAGADIIVTNDRHFNHPAVRAFGLRTATAAEIVNELDLQRKPT